MRNFKSGKTTKKRKIGITGIVFILVSVYFVTTFMDQQMVINKYNAQIEMYNAELKNKKALIEFYNSKQESITSDEYIETVARESLGLVKPYEKIFIDVNK